MSTIRKGLEALHRHLRLVQLDAPEFVLETDERVLEDRLAPLAGHLREALKVLPLYDLRVRGKAAIARRRDEECESCLHRLPSADEDGWCTRYSCADRPPTNCTWFRRWTPT